MRTLAFLFVFAASTLAAEPPTITIKKGDLVDIAISPVSGSDGQLATQVLKNDLTLAGYFNVRASGAGFTVSGSSTGSTLNGKVTDAGGGVVLQKSYSGSVRGRVHQFADDIVETLTGNRGIASTKIAFVATRTGRKEIYVADYDGANVQQLTRDNTISVGPSISPDGSRIAYTGYKSGYADIYLINLASGARDRVVKFPGTNSGAAFSPDGRQLAATVSKDGNSEIYVMSATGGGARRVTRTPGAEASPTWSPNGAELIYTLDAGGGPRLFRTGVSGGGARPVATGHSYNTEPNWSPDGRKVAFNIRSGGFKVAVLDLQSGSTRVLASGEDPAWGANSRHIVYSGGNALYLLDAQTGRSFKVIDGLGKVSEPSWSR